MEENKKGKGYDGVTPVQTPNGINITFLNVYEALEQESPRNVFLNGQLYVEDRIDTIISMYFGFDNNIRHDSILKFLKSRHCDFSSKIELLSMLINRYKDNNKSAILFIENRKIISSLRTIAQVRNAFQHRLIYLEALQEAIKEGSKFTLIDKKLDTCENLNGLVKMFKEEVILLIEELDKIMMKEIPHQKISIEDLKKRISSHGFDKKEGTKE